MLIKEHFDFGEDPRKGLCLKALCFVKLVSWTVLRGNISILKN